jgi:hypothetical protein
MINLLLPLTAAFVACAATVAALWLLHVLGT